MRESVPRQVDKKSGPLRRREGSGALEKESQNSRARIPPGILKQEERKNIFFFFLYIP